MNVEITTYLPNALKKESLKKNNEVLDILNERFSDEIRSIQDNVCSSLPIIEKISQTQDFVETKFSIKVSNFISSINSMVELHTSTADMVGDNIEGFEFVKVHVE